MPEMASIRRLIGDPKRLKRIREVTAFLLSRVVLLPLASARKVKTASVNMGVSTVLPYAKEIRLATDSDFNDNPRIGYLHRTTTTISIVRYIVDDLISRLRKSLIAFDATSANPVILTTLRDLSASAVLERRFWVASSHTF